MKQKDVVVGGTYVVKVSGRLVPVRLESASEYGGWNGRNIATGREIRIRTAAKLRRPITLCACGHLKSAHEHGIGSNGGWCGKIGCECREWRAAS